MLKDVADAALSDGGIDHEEGRGHSQRRDPDYGDQHQASDQREPCRALGAGPQQLRGCHAGEDEGAVVLQAGRDAESQPVQQQRSRATHGQSPVGNVEPDGDGQRQGNVERPEVAVANMQKGNGERGRRQEAGQPAVRAATELEDDQHGEAAQDRVENADAEVPGRLV